MTPHRHVAEWCSYACHGSRGEPMLNEPGKLFGRAVMWASVAVLGLCLMTEAVLAWLIDRGTDASSALTSLRVVALLIHPIFGILASFLLLSTLIWPRRRVPPPIAHVDDPAKGGDA